MSAASKNLDAEKHQREGAAAMTREQAIALARKHAKAKPKSYYAEPFEPHEWVIDAIHAAWKEGVQSMMANVGRSRSGKRRKQP